MMRMKGCPVATIVFISLIKYVRLWNSVGLPELLVVVSFSGVGCSGC